MIDKNENSWKLLLLIPTMSLRPLKRRGKRELNRSVTNGMDCYRSTCPIYPWRRIPETINREMRRYVYPQWRTVPCCKNPYRQRSIAPANDETVTWTGPSNTPSDQAHKDDTTCWWNRCCHEEISCGQAYSKFSKKILCWTGGMNILEHILASNKQTCDGLFNVCNVISRGLLAETTVPCTSVSCSTHSTSKIQWCCSTIMHDQRDLETTDSCNYLIWI